MGPFVSKGEKVTTAKKTERQAAQPEPGPGVGMCTCTTCRWKMLSMGHPSSSSHPWRRLPHLGHISPGDVVMASPLWTASGDGWPWLCASPALLSSMAGRRGGQGALAAQPAAEKCKQSLHVSVKVLACLSFPWELPQGRNSFLTLSSLVSTTSPAHAWLSVNVCGTNAWI